MATPKQLRMPTGAEIEAARDAKFGAGKPGRVAIDADPATCEVHFVFTDEDGKEVGREAVPEHEGETAAEGEHGESEHKGGLRSPKPSHAPSHGSHKAHES
jgi:hypothetical protein